MPNWKSIHKNLTPSYKKGWEEKGFNYEQAKEWVEVGVEYYEHDFAAYLREKGYSPSSNNIEKLIKLGKLDSQEEIDKKYPLEKRNEVTSFFIFTKGSGGSLEIKDFTKIKSLDLWRNRITNLEK